jgi:hypothetical protein
MLPVLGPRFTLGHVTPARGAWLARQALLVTFEAAGGGHGLIPSHYE